MTDMKKASQLLINVAGTEPILTAPLSTSNLLAKEVERLKEEVLQLKASLIKALSKLDLNSGGAEIADDDILETPLTPEDPTFVRIDMLKMLGPRSYHYGISYDPVVCFPPLNVSDMLIVCGCYDYDHVLGGKYNFKMNFNCSQYR